MNKRNLFSFVWLLALGTVPYRHKPNRLKRSATLSSRLLTMNINEGLSVRFSIILRGRFCVYKREEPVYQSIVRKLVAFSS